MKQFAGIDLDSLSSSSVQDLRAVSEAFRAKYKEKYILEADYLQPQTFIRVLKNYIQVNTTPTRNAIQSLAVLLKYLNEENELHAGSVNDNLTVLSLKINLQQRNGGDLAGNEVAALNFEQRVELVTRLQHKICFHDDFDYFVDKTVSAWNRKSFATAYLILRHIMEMSDVKPKIGDDALLPHTIALQLSYYIEMMEYLRERQYSDALKALYGILENALIYSINKLKSIPTPEEHPTKTHYLRELFFSMHVHHHSPHRQIEAEASQSLLLGSAKAEVQIPRKNSKSLAI
jgi:hypothetical protein